MGTLRIFLSSFYSSAFIAFNFFLVFRLHKPASPLLHELGSGDQFEHLLVATRLSWACFYSLQLHFWHGSHLFLSSKPECYSTKLSAEVCRSLVFLVGRGRIGLLATKSKLNDGNVSNLAMDYCWHLLWPL